jgi:nicotinate-nucleotide adenylyltransferase
VRLAIADNPAFDLCHLDVERGGLSYTADTLATLARQQPAADLYFVMGEDSLADLPTWHAPERILTLARLAVALRPGVAIDLERLEQALPGISARVDVIATPEIGIAARDLRARVAAGRPIRYQVPAIVEEYIIARRLYRSAGASSHP